MRSPEGSAAAKEMAQKQARVGLCEDRAFRRTDHTYRAWYERLALVLMNHYNTTPEGKEEKMQEATEICIDGLLDEDTHLSAFLIVSSLLIADLPQSIDHPSLEG